MILIATILFATILFIDLRIDYRRWKKEKYFTHEKKWFRGAVLLPSVTLLAVALRGNIIFDIIYCWMLVGFTYWTLFDGIYNIARRLPWNYSGFPDKFDASLDKIQREHPKLWIVKACVSILLKIGYLLMFVL